MKRIIIVCAFLVLPFLDVFKQLLKKKNLFKNDLINIPRLGIFE
jgi:hypothetical protein